MFFENNFDAVALRKEREVAKTRSFLLISPFFMTF